MLECTVETLFRTERIYAREILRILCFSTIAGMWVSAWLFFRKTVFTFYFKIILCIIL